MRKKRLFFCFFVTACLAACDFVDYIPERVTTAAEEAVFDVSPGFTRLEEADKDDAASGQYAVCIRDDEYTLSMYEPYYDCYLGAYIEEDNIISGNIGMFERLSGVEHGIYFYRHTLGETFPAVFVLQNLARSKVPMIEIYPENIYLQIDYQAIEDTAKAFGEFNVPMFIGFNASKAGYGKGMSKEFCTALRTAFLEFAPQCAFVWSVSSESGEDMAGYYPGDEWADWVGIEAFSNVLPDGTHEDIFSEDFNAFYYAFQGRKPIMITGLGVSNFSGVDYAYKISEASDGIQKIYAGIANRYPRIKAVIYSDCTDDSRKTKQSYQLSDNDSLMNAYKSGTEQERYTPTIDTRSTGEKSSQWILSRCIAQVVDGKSFISKQSFESEFGFKDLELSKYSKYQTVIDGETYFDTSALNDLGMRRVKIDEKSRKIFISKN